MTHEKLVTGTESPTRYTKIIRNPGAGTKYNRTYQEAGYVSRYTKTVAGGKDYSPPAPPPPPPTEIGAVTIDPDSAVATVMGNQTFTAVVTGGDATDLKYKWTVRSGNAQLDTPDNQATVTYTFIRDGQTQIQCAVSSANSSNSPQSNIGFVLVNA
jgi:hypothetical protein